MLEQAGILGPLLTILSTLFVLELTDKDALLLISLATTKSPWLVFAAGSAAFTITSAVIVLIGSALVSYVPVFWIKIASGGVMLAYAVWSYAEGAKAEEGVEREEERLLARAGRRELVAFLAMVSSLIALDLAGDATELVTILFVAQFRDVFLVFGGAVVALVAATAFETALGNRLGRILSARRAKYLSAAVLLTVGTAVVVTSVLGL